MNTRSKKYANYWRQSLADTELGKGVLSDGELKRFTKQPLEALANGVLNTERLIDLFKGEPEHIESIDLIIRPKIFMRKFEHGVRVRGGQPEIIAPMSCCVRVNRAGEMYPSGKTVIARDILEPIDRGGFTIGDVSAMDDYLSRHRHPLERDEGREHAKIWPEYLAYCDQFLYAVSGDWPQKSDDYVQAEYWCLQKVEVTGSPSKHIFAAYDDIIKNNPKASLFDTYALDRTTPDEACLESEFTFRARCAHSGDEHPLADAQRDALAHLMIADIGNIVAVNGPPGTGKTTMLLSAVASLWTQAALDQGNPPVIVAASTNNQAVTNILDAFGKDFKSGTGPFKGRWLPNIKSFGAYFPSKSKGDEAAKKYQTEQFFNEVETLEYFDQASKQFIDAGKHAFPNLAKVDVSSIVASLHAELCTEADKLSLIIVDPDFRTVN